MPQFPETERITSKLPFYRGGIITSWSSTFAGGTTSAVQTGTNWSSANRGIFVPILIPERVTVTHLGWYNGTTAAHNADCGIYTEDQTLIISTTPTAQSGTSQWQTVNITDTSLGPGVFYLAISLSGTSRLGFLNILNSIQAAAGIAMQDSVGTLPATATMAALTVAQWPIIIALTDTTA